MFKSIMKSWGYIPEMESEMEKYTKAKEHAKSIANLLDNYQEAKKELESATERVHELESDRDWLNVELQKARDDRQAAIDELQEALNKKTDEGILMDVGELVRKLNEAGLDSEEYYEFKAVLPADVLSTLSPGEDKSLVELYKMQMESFVVSALNEASQDGEGDDE